MKTAALAVLLVAAAVACKDSERRGGVRLSRSGDGAAVVVVDTPTESGTIVDEREPNDDAPQRVEADGVRGTLASAADADVYEFRAGSEGWAEARVAGIAGVDLVLELQTSDGKRLAISDRGPAERSEGVIGFPVDGDSSYRVVVREFVPKRKKKSAGREGASPPYVVSWRVADAADRREVEPNETAEGAAELPLGEERTGYYGWNGDVDTWRLDLSDLAPGEREGEGDDDGRPAEVVDVTLGGVEGVSPTLAITRASGEVVTRRTAARGAGIALRALSADPGDPVLLAVLESKRTHPDDGYVLRAVVRPHGAGEELEPNDVAQRATLLPAPVAGGLERVSGTTGAGDVDYWRLPVADEPRTLEASASAPTGVDIVLEAASDGGTMLARANAGEAGVSEQLRGVPVPAGTEIVIAVRGGDRPADAQDYQLSYSTVRGLVAPDPLAPQLSE